MEENEKRYKRNRLSKEEKTEILRQWKDEKNTRKGIAKERRAQRRLIRKSLPIYIKLTAGAVLILVIFIVTNLALSLYEGYRFNSEEKIKKYIDNHDNEVIAVSDMDMVYSIAPIDEEGASKIEQMPDYGVNDTWGVYIYMIGSNLESLGENDLSDVTQYVIDNYVPEESEPNYSVYDDYIMTLKEAGMNPPSNLLHVSRPEEYEIHTYTEEIVRTDLDGAAESDISEILRSDLSDNVDVVIQTGGATRWSNPLINPNYIQRFSVKNGGIYEEYSEPTKNMCETDTLAEFLSYCKEYHDADHRILIFWDHGSGPFGFGYDELFDGKFSISEIVDAVSKTYVYDKENPPFEVVFFDACLMANIDVISSFEGYCKYFAGCEESVPGDGGYYTDWLTQLAAKPSMNGAKVARMIADGYMDYYAKGQVVDDPYIGSSSSTFSVMDTNLCAETLRAYYRLCKKVLEDSLENTGVIADMSRAAGGSIRYGMDHYDIYNLVDMGLFMDGFSDEYPKETAEIKGLLKQAVLYNRSDSQYEGSQGVSIYYPVTVNSMSGLNTAMKYIFSISADEAVKSLYYYKIAGCLNDDMKEYMAQNYSDALSNIDFYALEQAQMGTISIIGEGNFSVAISEEARNLMQDYVLNLSSYDEKSGEIVYYGNVSCVYMDDTGKMTTDFDGEWISLDGVLLPLEVIDSTDHSARYRSKVLLDGDLAYLIIDYNKDTEIAKIMGGYIQNFEGVDSSMEKKVSDLWPGMVIEPVYDVSNMYDNSEGVKYGKKIKYKDNLEVAATKLPSGDYYETILFTNIRGDEYNTGIVSFNMDSKGINHTVTNDDVSVIYE